MGLKIRSAAKKLKTKRKAYIKPHSPLSIKQGMGENYHTISFLHRDSWRTDFSPIFALHALTPPLHALQPPLHV